MIVERPKEGRLRLIGPFGSANYAMLSTRLESARYERVGTTPTFNMPETAHNVRVISSCVGEIDWRCDAKQRIFMQEEAYKHLAKIDDFVFMTEPFPHQLEDLRRSANMRSFMFAWEMGIGKSKIAIDTAAYLFTKGAITQAIILAPNGVHRQWVDPDPEYGQFSRHCPVPFSAHLWRSSWPKKAREAFMTDRDERRLRVLAMNSEAMSLLPRAKELVAYLQERPSLLIVDESHMIKTPNAARTKNITQAGKYAKYRRTLTGTPDPNGVKDLFSQYRFLDPNIIGMQTFTAFSNEYCVRGGFENKQIVGYRNLPDLQKKIAPFTSIRKKADCADLPEKIYIRRAVEMSDEQARLYNEVKRALKDYVENPTFEITNALDQLTKLRQILGGVEPETGRVLGTERAETVTDIVTQSAGRKIIWACHTAELHLVGRHLREAGHPVDLYYGDLSEGDRARALERWRASDSACLVANPAAGGTGLNLDGAPTVIYYTHSFNAVHRWQSEDRSHRITTKSAVTYYDLYVPRSLDVQILSALKKKKNLSDLNASGIREFVRGLAFSEA